MPIVTPDDLGNLDRHFARVLFDACVSYFTHDTFGGVPAHLPVEIPTALELGIRRYAFVIAR